MTAVILPSEQEFFAAISDYGDVLIKAGGKHLSLQSTLLEAQSSVFRSRLAEFRAGSNSELWDQDGKIVVDLECSYSAAQLLFRFISSRGTQLMDDSVSPAILRELAWVAKEWAVDSLLSAVDAVLAQQLHSDIQRSASDDAKTWQYSGGHIRERAVKMLQLALEVGLEQVQAEAELLIAANWSYLSSDPRIANELDVTSFCRLQQTAFSMQQAPSHFKGVLPGGRCRSKRSRHQASKFRQKAAK